jgi:hypothetical protein
LGQRIRHCRRVVWQHFHVVQVVLHHLKLNGPKMARLYTWKNDSKSFKADRSKSMVSVRFLFILFYLALRSRETFLLLQTISWEISFFGHTHKYTQIHTHSKHINERVWRREISQLLHRHNEHTLNVCITRRNLFYFTHFSIVRWNPFA